MALEILVHRRLPFEAGEHQPRAGGVRSDQVERRAAVQLDPLSRGQSQGAGAVGAADLDDPPVVVELGSSRCEVHPDVSAVLAGGGDCGRDRRGDVDHDHVARLEQLGQLGEDVMADHLVAASRDEEPHPVAGESASLRRLVSLERRPELERERGHAGTAPRSRVGSSRAR